jgi:PilZ domain
VKDISAGGAMAQVASSAAVPTRVYLWQSKTWTFFECEVKWRKPGQIGLHFIDVASRRKSLALIEQYGLAQSLGTPPAARDAPTHARPGSMASGQPQPNRQDPLAQTKLPGLGLAPATPLSSGR